MGRRVKKAFTITVVIIIEIDRDRRGDWERGWNVAKGIVGGSVRCRRSAQRLHAVHDRAGVGSEAISSGYICMTNEDVIDLYKRVTPGTVGWCWGRTRATRPLVRGWPRAAIRSSSQASGFQASRKNGEYHI